MIIFFITIFSNFIIYSFEKLMTQKSNMIEVIVDQYWCSISLLKVYLFIISNLYNYFNFILTFIIILYFLLCMLHAWLFISILESIHLGFSQFYYLKYYKYFYLSFTIINDIQHFDYLQLVIVIWIRMALIADL